MVVLVVAGHVAITAIPLATVIRTAILDASIKTACRCDVPGHDHTSCPMHHSPSALRQAPSNTANCRLTQASTIKLDVLLAAGSLPEAVLRLTAPGTSAAVTIRAALDPETRSPALDPPPPRS